MLNEYFETTDYKNLKLTKDQSLLIGKKIQLVKGEDFHKSIYDIPDKTKVENVIVRYYQIASFDDFGKCAIRSFLFEGTSTKGACFFNYKIKELKDYLLSKDKINDFVKVLDAQKKKNNNKTKLMYKFYPVYNFEYTNPPTGNDINECVSELLN